MTLPPQQTPAPTPMCAFTYHGWRCIEPFGHVGGHSCASAPPTPPEGETITQEEILALTDLLTVIDTDNIEDIVALSRSLLAKVVALRAARGAGAEP